jgi:hypothetical protein
MNRTLLLGACIALAGCASSHIDPTSTSAVDAAKPTDALPAALTSVRTVEMASLDDEERCRIERPTGSRIAVRRCSTLTPEQQELQGTVARRELEDMRQRQMYQEQSRRAMEAAMRQRIPSP